MTEHHLQRYIKQYQADAEKELPLPFWRPLTTVLVRPDDQQRIDEYRAYKSLK